MWWVGVRIGIWGSAKICYWRPTSKKTLAPASWAKVSSTFGSGWTSLSTLWLSGLRSMYILTFPVFLGTTTIPAHHPVGSVFLELTLAFSILSSSSATCNWRGRGTCHGVKIVYGFASKWSWMLYSPARVPSCWNATRVKVLSFSLPVFATAFKSTLSKAGGPTESSLDQAVQEELWEHVLYLHHLLPNHYSRQRW